MSKRPAGPAYQLLASRLREKIRRGAFVAGGRLPGEMELCEMFGASRITVRRSLQILEEELLIQRRRGSGTFVSASPTRKIPVLNADFSGSVTRHAPELRRRVEFSRWTQPDAEVAAILRLDPGVRILHARRVDLIGRRPAAFDDAYIVDSAAGKLDAAVFGEIRFAEAWSAAQGIRLSQVKQAIEASRAEPPVAELLQVEVGEPVLRETATYYQGAAAVGLFISYYRSDLFRFASTYTL